MRTLNRWTLLGLSCLGLAALAQAPAPAPATAPQPAAAPAAPGPTQDAAAPLGLGVRRRGGEQAPPQGPRHQQLALSPHPSDGAPIFYGVRLLSFVIILVAIADKNRQPR